MEATLTEVEEVTTIIEVETVDITDRILEATVDTVSSQLGTVGMDSNLPGTADMAINPLEMVELEVTRATIEVVETTRMTGMEASNRAVEVEGAVVVVDTVAGVETAGTTATEMVLERMLVNPEEDTTHEGIG